MLYFLYAYAHDWWSGFNLFKYITFRSIGALLTALIFSFLMGPRFISWMKRLQKKGQPIRSDGPQGHLITKQGTPTMGGMLILMSVFFSGILWAKLTDPFFWVVMGITLGYGTIGFMDDFLKVKRHNPKGLPGRYKLLFQVLMGVVAVLVIEAFTPASIASSVMIPFMKNFYVHLGLFFIPFACLVMIGASNAVNLTDGLDGLAIVPVIIATLCFAILAYITGNHIFANYLQVHYVPGSGELAVFCCALAGAGLGFLWFNAPPAMVFMGDTGSLAMGGALGAISVITQMELVLFIIGGLFVIEALSVMLQVGYFKLTKGKRIFLMAPLHHHFEKKGWSEATIVIRFWIISILLAVVGLSALKLR